jgi:hypothetical protein
MGAASEIIVASQRRSLARPKSVRSWARNRLCLNLRHVSPPFKAGAQACLSATGSSLRGKADDRRCIGARTRNSQLFRRITKRQRSNAISAHSDQVFSRFAGAVVREAIARLRPSGSGAAAFVRFAPSRYGSPSRSSRSERRLMGPGVVAQIRSINGLATR